MTKHAKTKAKTKPQSSNPLAQLDRYVRSYNFIGLAFAVGFFCLSLFPSLLPRSWLLQGLVSGIALAIGYGVGTFVSFMIRWLFERDVLIGRKAVAWKLLYGLGSVLVVSFLLLGMSWQRQLREVVEAQPLEQPYVLLVLVLAVLSGIGCIKLGRLTRRLYRWIVAKIDRLMPRRISMALSFTLVGLSVAWVVSGAFLNFLGSASSLVYDRKNNSTPEGVSQPILDSRSGSKESLVAWDTLGYQGKKFVASGPSQDKLRNFSGTEPSQQIRLYVGVNSASTAYDRAKLAVQELNRTGAFKRDVLVVATPTGTGWMNPQSVDALEYMYNGNTAIVAQQYSYLPSWISFLVDKQKAEDSGKALYDAVYAEWSTLPTTERPKLLMYGLSLGSFGGQAAFSGPGDMIHSVDGALWQGTPGDTELWKEVTRRRDANSPEWQPIIDKGADIQFASQPNDITRNLKDRGKPKVLYVQHGSDPIVWFNFNLPLHKSDWFGEDRAPDVMDNTIWAPFVTFFQLAADQVVGMGVPRSYGHNYETTVAHAWAAIAEPEGWTEAKANKLQSIIDRY